MNTLKAAVSAGSTMDPTWAGALVPDYQTLTGEFLDYLRPKTIIGQLTGFTKVPFRVKVNKQTSGAKAKWVGEGRAKPVSSWSLDNVELGHHKVATIAVLTDELIRFSGIDAENYVFNELSKAVIATLDESLIDPGFAGVADESPASLLYGVTPVISSGSDLDAIKSDVKAIFRKFIAAHLSLRGATWVMNTNTALSLSLMSNDLTDELLFPDISIDGGKFFGLNAVVSEYVDPGVVALIHTPSVFLADDNEIMLDSSREASLLMDDAPNMNSTTPTASNVVSLWQTNSVGFRAERYISWAKAREEAAQYITGVNWGELSAS